MKVLVKSFSSNDFYAEIDKETTIEQFKTSYFSASALVILNKRLLSNNTLIADHVKRRSDFLFVLVESPVLLKQIENEVRLEKSSEASLLLERAGFSKKHVTAALVLSNNDPARALEFLITSFSETEPSLRRCKELRSFKEFLMKESVRTREVVEAELRKLSPGVAKALLDDCGVELLPSISILRSIEFSEGEMAVIEKLSQLGVDRALVVDAYLKCNRSEEETCSYLLEEL